MCVSGDIHVLSQAKHIENTQINLKPVNNTNNNGRKRKVTVQNTKPQQFNMNNRKEKTDQMSWITELGPPAKEKKS